MVDWFSIVLLPVTLGWIVLLVIALREIFTSPSLTDTNRLLWGLIVLVAPVAGLLIWFFAGRNRTGSLDRR
jgi:hypothetical protein